MHHRNSSVSSSSRRYEDDSMPQQHSTLQATSQRRPIYNNEPEGYVSDSPRKQHGGGYSEENQGSVYIQPVSPPRSTYSQSTSHQLVRDYPSPYRVPLRTESMNEYNLALNNNSMSLPPNRNSVSSTGSYLQIHSPRLQPDQQGRQQQRQQQQYAHQQYQMSPNQQSQSRSHSVYTTSSTRTPIVSSQLSPLTSQSGRHHSGIPYRDVRPIPFTPSIDVDEGLEREEEARSTRSFAHLQNSSSPGRHQFESHGRYRPFTDSSMTMTPFEPQSPPRQQPQPQSPHQPQQQKKQLLSPNAIAPRRIEVNDPRLNTVRVTSRPDLSQFSPLASYTSDRRRDAGANSSLHSSSMSS